MYTLYSTIVPCTMVQLCTISSLNANAKLRLERAEFVGCDVRTAGANRAQQAPVFPWADNVQRERAAWAATAFRNELQGRYGRKRAPRGG